MLNEIERDQLAAMLQAYSPADIVEGLIGEIQKAAIAAPVGAAWGRDALTLQRVLPRLWVKRGKGAK